MSKAYETVKIEREQSVLWIILNRPHRLNAFNDVLLEELADALDTAEKDPSIRCLVVTGEGDRAFSAGADVTMFPKATPAKAEEFSRFGQKVFGKIEEMSKPVIAAINGFALGGGLELALACDFRIAAEHAELGSPEILLGLIPGWGGTQRLVRIVGLAKAKEMIMLGVRLKADEALKAGLVHKIVHYEKLKDEVRAIVQKLAEGPPVAMKYAKHALNFGTQVPLDVGLRLESGLMGLSFSTEDLKEGVEAFMSRRKAEFKGK
ncbi:MAG: enoyl-CoA hydratase-related protein [Candidatus Bathyarchaeota archaeon]|jgi:enoyl-CoA hydratase/3-hydroxyacyl-CoA dehydrogenase|nr:crotonase [Candidatus Bathyarchaeota archaeon A05DMB-5]MDH7557624.1 enoyl-CoA hydratase-related protein [Candidatus Bathyarchaeota archaeon]